MYSRFLNESTEFQSPHGDSFFSDLKQVEYVTHAYGFGFNPLTGIRSFLTVKGVGFERELVTVSIPSRGFVLF